MASTVGAANGRGLEKEEPQPLPRPHDAGPCTVKDRINGKAEHHVLICSEEGMEEAAKFSAKLSENMESFRTLTCADKSIFNTTKLLLSSFTKLYLFLDADLATAMLRKGRLHDTVYDFFDVLTYPPFPSVETEIDEENQKSENKRMVYVINKFGQKDRRYNEILYQLPRDCTQEIKDIQVSTLPQHMADMVGLDSDEREMAHEGVANVMIGSHCQMNISPSSNQLLIARQDGSENIVNINIVPSPSTSKLLIIITTDPCSPEVEDLLVQEIDEKKEILNIKLKSSDAQIVSVKKGSVIIEIDVKPGQTMGTEWIESVVKTVLPEEVISVVSKGTQLNLDVTSKVVVPIVGHAESESFLQNVLLDKFVSRKENLDKGKQLQTLKQSSLDHNRVVSKKTGGTKSEQDRSAVPVEKLRQILESVVNFGIDLDSDELDSVDIEIELLEVLAELAGEDIWHYVIKMPQLFSVGGLIYKKVDRDLHLNHEKHFQIEFLGLEGAQFLYNAKSQSIELCVGPHGHYTIGPDIQDHIEIESSSKTSSKQPVEKHSKHMTQINRSTTPDSEVEKRSCFEIGSRSDVEEDDSLTDLDIHKHTYSKKEKTSEVDSGLSDQPTHHGFGRSGESDGISDLLKNKKKHAGKGKITQVDSGLSDVFSYEQDD